MERFRNLSEEERQALIERIKSRTREDDGCWLYGKGLGLMPKKIQIETKSFLVHVVMYALHNPPDPREAEGVKLVVRHKCHRPACCNPDHLLIGTQKENMADYSEKCRSRHAPTAKIYRQ